MTVRATALAMLLILAATVSAQENAEPAAEVAVEGSLVELSAGAVDLLAAGVATEEVTAKQQAIVDTLRQLLGDAKSQSGQLPETVASPRPAASGAQRNAPGSGNSQSGSAAGRRREDGTESSQAQGAQAPDLKGELTQRDGLAEAVWGHLPPRVRDELYRSYTERFVPEYSPLLRRYFKTLAEQSKQRRK